MPPELPASGTPPETTARWCAGVGCGPDDRQPITATRVPRNLGRGKSGATQKHGLFQGDAINGQPRSIEGNLSPTSFARSVEIMRDVVDMQIEGPFLHAMHKGAGKPQSTKHFELQIMAGAKAGGTNN